jgi:hypothetical protein
MTRILENPPIGCWYFTNQALPPPGVCCVCAARDGYLWMDETNVNGSWENPMSSKVFAWKAEAGPIAAIWPD